MMVSANDAAFLRLSKLKLEGKVLRGKIYFFRVVCSAWGSVAAAA